MDKTNFKTLKIAQRIPLAALAFLPMLFNGCAQTGTASKQSNVPSANPALYNYNPASRDFETRWPFGPANYH
jgi:PBP1b-binding outer membrane lipoprotein LpoB